MKETNSDFCDNMNITTRSILKAKTADYIVATIPYQVFNLAIMFIGITGNALVIVIYIRKLKKSSAIYFILFLAVVDICCCIFIIPWDFFLIHHKYILTHGGLCTIFEWLRNSSAFMSCLMLLYIAIDRYFSICKPLSFVIHEEKAKHIIALNLIVSLLVMSISIFLFGYHTIVLEDGLVGCTCYIRDKYVGTGIHIAFRSIILILQTLLFVIMIFSYSSVYMTVHKRGRMSVLPCTQSGSTHSLSPSLIIDNNGPRKVSHDLANQKGDNEVNETENNITSPDLANQCRASKLQHALSLRSVGLESLVSGNSNMKESSMGKVLHLRRRFINMFAKKHSNSENVPNAELAEQSPHEIHFRRSVSTWSNGSALSKYFPRKRTRKISPSIQPLTKNDQIFQFPEGMISHYQRARYKTAKLLLLVTVVFLLSWLPYWLLSVTQMVDTNTWVNMCYWRLNSFKILRHFYFMSYAANPIVYAFASSRFRGELKVTAQSMWTRLKRICNYGKH